MKPPSTLLDSAAALLMDAVRAQRFEGAQDLLAHYRARLDQALEASKGDAAEGERLFASAVQTLTEARRLTELLRAHDMRSEWRLAGAMQYGGARAHESRGRAIG